MTGTSVRRVAYTVVLAVAVCARLDAADTNWPSFRGHNADGVADGYATATEWSVPDHKNIAWTAPIPGQGHSSPVVWGDRLFVTTAVSGMDDPELRVGLYGSIEPVQDDTVHRYEVHCLDKNTGVPLWTRVALEAVPEIKRHTKATHANCTPATDGSHVVAFFGSDGLYCYTVDGDLLWEKDLGVLDSGYFVVPEAQWGFASSPIIHDEMVIVQCDVQENSFIAAFSIHDGEQVWRTPRDDVPTWSTPTIYPHADGARVAVNGYRHMAGYDARTGAEVWRMSGGGDIPVPTPIIANDLIYITKAHGDGAPLYAVRPTAVGDITLPDGETASDAVAWGTPGNGAYMQTPIAYGAYLYSCRDSGVVKCYAAETGELIYEQRLGSGRTGFTASPIAADGKLYFTSELGTTYVVAPGPELEVLSVNELDDICMATPAASEGALYFRTRGAVIAVAE
ncbi:PQQ-binding-like beta-propeller repeat protein [Candidatus Poribacteria bacterium]|jgi:outer membrane protein assembly factor BamB|nr:PQQ-binding-like beta-propeller repeat protein [Candidatus Poribacteria bacterium]MBT5534031.1 PQQ-binding-like beta-propeller repeat protein [Candidatus Poribacteria bacterium]MBT5713678.1 PQQ-binding-like beta-propeller repeat protein [Candidatus Poribacteria bacterium]MBT7097088.1 PQQ-binding-like beta-propeller repeat protein [Candidatus Poribacteria bacterium]MBT7809095.1 PQQ-binding-like beta-propeller repeat protein [Candidatus Poribacteria bacterium]